MEENLPNNHGEAAAIMIGAAAVGYALFQRDGLYQEYDAGVALAIAFVLIAYIWDSPRTIMQSVAVASLLGGCAIPVVGYIAILLFHPDPDPKTGFAGSVGDNAVGTATLIIFGMVAWALDRRQNKNRTRV